MRPSASKKRLRLENLSTQDKYSRIAWEITHLGHRFFFHIAHGHRSTKRKLTVAILSHAQGKQLMSWVPHWSNPLCHCRGLGSTREQTFFNRYARARRFSGLNIGGAKYERGTARSGTIRHNQRTVTEWNRLDWISTTHYKRGAPLPLCAVKGWKTARIRTEFCSRPYEDFLNRSSFLFGASHMSVW